MDNKVLCNNCEVAKYCSQECAIFDVAHRHPHHGYPELTPCRAIEELEGIVTEESHCVWDIFSNDPDFCF